MDDLYQIPLFEGVDDDEFVWLMAHSHEQTIDTDAYFYREGEPVDQFYIVLEGELQITRNLNGRHTVMGTTPRGVIGGEIALLNRGPSQVSACAIEPTRLLLFDEQAFRALFAECPIVGMRILQIAAERMQGTVSIQVQQQKTMALGKLSAGLAHELNNPAAATRRAAKSLRERFADLQAHAVTLSALGFGAEQASHLIAFQQRATATALETPVLGALAQSEREDALADWLDERGVADGWEMAESFVTAGLTADDLDELLTDIPDDQIEAVLTWFHDAMDAVTLLDEIEQGSSRISDLVRAIKSYTYMDQGEVQDINVHEGIDNTLTVLRHKLGAINVVREYDPDLPIIQARGSELNQVWTNLLDNAIDALADSGEIRLITRRETDFIMVEVADNGPGIPEDIQERIFEPFFTTKDVGVGTGLGLDISYRIVQQHHGTMELRSEPGNTRFIVRLPVVAVTE